MPFGQTRYEETNALLNARFAEKGVLVCAHRGSWHGNVIQNTNIAYRAALMQGADVLETDAVASRDGVVFSMHDGVEWRMFGTPRNAAKLSAAEIQARHPLNALGEPSSHSVQPMSEVFEFLTHGELINVDRGWRARDLLLPLMDHYPHMLRQAVVKAPLDCADFIAQLDRHPVKYMFMPICATLAEVEEALKLDVNLVGVELIAHSVQDEAYQDETIRWIHSKGLFCWVNALNLGDCYPGTALFGDLDDDISIWEGPARGWGRMIDKGIDVIQTDWPALVRDFRKEKINK